MAAWLRRGALWSVEQDTRADALVPDERLTRAQQVCAWRPHGKTIKTQSETQGGRAEKKPRSTGALKVTIDLVFAQYAGTNGAKLYGDNDLQNQPKKNQGGGAAAARAWSGTLFSLGVGLCDLMRCVRCRHSI